jgi:hypothetical protein
MSSKILEFRDGIYMLSLLTCLQQEEIEKKDIENFDFEKCYQKKKGEEFKESFREPYSKIKERIENIHKIIKKLNPIFKLKTIEQTIITTFLEESRLESLYVIENLFNKLEKNIGGIKIKRPNKTTYNILRNFMEEEEEDGTLNKLKDYWSNFWKDKGSENPYYNLSNKITSFNYSLLYGKDGCIKDKAYNIERFDNIIKANKLLNDIQDKLDSDFYVYRSIRESDSYNPEDKISKLLRGEEIEEEYPTLISTSWNLDFALNWSEDKYCCLYVIKVPKDSNYLILKDSFDESEESQNEITLGPGKITLTDIAVSTVFNCKNKYNRYTKEIFVFFGEYESNKNLNRTQLFNSLCPEDEKFEESKIESDEDFQESDKDKESKIEESDEESDEDFEEYLRQRDSKKRKFDNL